jgi:hypothetical protein
MVYKLLEKTNDIDEQKYVPQKKNYVGLLVTNKIKSELFIWL